MVVESYEQAMEIARDAVKNNSVFTTLDCSPCMASYTVDAEGVESWDVYNK